MGRPIALSLNTNPDQLKPLHIAVISNNLSAVKVLLQNGADIDVRTRSGATPLMLACLFGRRRLISYLLTKNASHKAKDFRGNRLWNYFRPDREILTRYRAPRLMRILDSIKKARRWIRKRVFCSSEALRSRANSQTHPLHDCFFYPQKGRLMLLQLVSIVNTNPKQHLGKTRGCIAGDGLPKPTVFAISGWRDGGKTGLLSNSDYTDKVIALCEELNFHLQNVTYNDAMRLEEEGRGSACHVEKQLAVFWLEETLKFTGRGNLTKANIASLKGAALPIYRRHAFIYLDNHPCLDCWKFLAKLRQTSGLEFTTVYRPFVAHAHREKASFLKANELPKSNCVREHSSDEPNPTQMSDEEQTQAGSHNESQDEENLQEDAVHDIDAMPDTVHKDIELESTESSQSEAEDDSEHISHGAEVQSLMSLEHKRDTPSPVASYGEHFTPDQDRSHYFATTPSPPRTKILTPYHKGKTPTKFDPTSRETGTWHLWGTPQSNNPTHIMNPFAPELSSRQRNVSLGVLSKEKVKPLPTPTSNPRPSDLSISGTFKSREAVMSLMHDKDEPLPSTEVVLASDDDSDVGFTPSPTALSTERVQDLPKGTKVLGRARTPKARRLLKPLGRYGGGEYTPRRLFGHSVRTNAGRKTNLIRRDQPSTRKSERSTRTSRIQDDVMPAATRRFPNLSSYIHKEKNAQ